LPLFSPREGANKATKFLRCRESALLQFPTSAGRSFFSCRNQAAESKGENIMGLDIYGVYAHPNGNVRREYYSQNYALNDWMELRYIAKGGLVPEGDEYCNLDVELDAADLDALENDIRAGKVSQDDFHDLEFVYKARRHLADGYLVTYSANW
jgi:hypothetical protein